MINGLIGGLTVLVIYAIAARLFSRPAARWAALFMAFFPQMVFWSTGMYKDPAILLCIAVAMYAVLGLRERLSPGMIALFVTAEVVLIMLRFYIAYFVLFSALATFVFAAAAAPSGWCSRTGSWSWCCSALLTLPSSARPERQATP
jgi:4-amino-4-deoxy-L-arabinose transferase-like glycosyltransferase